MMSWFNISFNSTIFIVLMTAYNAVAAINNDIRLLRNKKNDTTSPAPNTLPRWTRYMRWTEPAIFFIMLVLNWKFALIAWVTKAILQALLVLELIGYIILYPFNLRR